MDTLCLFTAESFIRITISAECLFHIGHVALFKRGRVGAELQGGEGAAGPSSEWQERGSLPGWCWAALGKRSRCPQSQPQHPCSHSMTHRVHRPPWTSREGQGQRPVDFVPGGSENMAQDPNRCIRHQEAAERRGETRHLRSPAQTLLRLKR